jgi:hypothetical protein
MNPALLHVIAVISNPVRYRSRVRLMKEFMGRLQASGVTLWVVEATFGERAPSVLDPSNPRHIAVRCDHELWLKENLINVGARVLPTDVRYVMWCDGDIAFQREDWASETLEALQHHPVVQPFSHVVDFGPSTEILETHKGFAYCYRMGDRLGPQNKLGNWIYGGPYWHPGYAFAFRMEAWNRLGGLLDRAIMGAADYHMACALIGQADYSYPQTVNRNYREMIKAWEARAEASVGRDIGFVPGTVLHYYHGSKSLRRYTERWDVIVGNDFDPTRDVAYDRHGVLQWTTGKRRLIDQSRDYFRERQEDL